MYKKISFFFFFFLGLIILNGCSNKTVFIETKYPAQNDILLKKKKIAILPFKGDTIGFKDKLETELNNIYCGNKPCFIIVSREKLQNILNELKLQASDLSAEKRSEFGKIIGANVFITGNVKNIVNTNVYFKPIQYCAVYSKGKCKYYATKYKTCYVNRVKLNVNIKAIDVKTSRVLDSCFFNKSLASDSCNDYRYYTTDQLENNLINQALNDYIDRIAPHYVSFQTELIDDVDSVDLTSKQEKMFENALKYIEEGRTRLAEQLLKKLNLELNSQSFEILYDIGIVEEMLGNYEEAYAAYKMANNLIVKKNLEPNELLNSAILRIKEILNNQKKLKKQLNEVK